MLTLFFWILIGSMISLAGMQIVFVIYYRKILKNSGLTATDLARSDLADLIPSPAPKVAIVLCLRGPDPALTNCLTGLLEQRYPNFEMHLIVDSDDDPVIPVVTSVLQTIDSAVEPHWHTVVNHSSDCSLKCSALVTAVEALESQHSPPKIVAFVDADALVAPDWLNHLVVPLLDTSENSNLASKPNAFSVGATTGNRWFEPTQSNLGSRFRAAWNAAALPQMQIYQVAWGGSLAMKLETIRQCSLLDRWSKAFCEDTMLADILNDHGMRVQRVPELVVVNRESTKLKPALGWIGRQLLTVRLHHRDWPLIFSHALLSGFCFFGPLLFAAMMAFANPPLAIGAGIAWCVQLFVNISLFNVVRRLNVELIEEVALKSTTAGGMLSKIVVVVALQAINPFVAIGVAFQRKVSWRGIDYRIGRNSRVQMLHYVPYSEILHEDQHSIH